MANNVFKQERIDFAKFHKIAERQLLPIFRKALKEQILRVIQYAKDYGIESIRPEGLINTNVWEKTYLNAFNIIGMKAARKEYYYQRTIEGIETKASAIEFLVDIWSRTFRDYALQYTYGIAQKLNQTTIDIINRALGDTYELGLDRDGSIRLFEKNLNTAMRTRSVTMSRTEATTISNLGKEVGARSWIDEQGGGGYKVWLGRNDERERKTHLQENNTVIPIDDLYSLNGDLAERPGDVNLQVENRINCRCTQSLMSRTRYEAYLKRGRIENGKLTGAS